MDNIKILLVEDHSLVRAGIRELLQKIKDFEVIAETGDGYEAIELVAQKIPDVALIDISMPGLNGIEVAARIIREFSQTKVIILSMHENEEYILQALRIGAKGYLLKDAEIAELELAIRSVIKGKIYLSPSISKHIIDEYFLKTGTKKDESVFEILTSRQREILQLIAEGMTTKEIASKLDLSIKTVEAHRMQIMERLDIHDVAGLVRYAIRTGIISSV